MASTPTSSSGGGSSSSKSFTNRTPAPQKDLLPPTPGPDKKPAKNRVPDADEALIHEIVEVVSKHQSGTIYDNNPTFNLREQHVYDRLLNTLHQHNLEAHFESLRYRWSSDLGILTLLLVAPDPFHEHYTSQVDGETKYQLERQLPAQYPSLAPLCQDLYHVGTSSVKTKNQTFSHCPDGQWRYKRSEIPAFVFEVAFGQSAPNVLQVCQGYLNYFPNMLGGVLGFNFTHEPQDSQYTASVFLFKASILEDKKTLKCELLANKQFRIKGQPQAGSLSIPFELFLPPYQRHRIPDDAKTASIHLDFALLNKWAERAEFQQSLKGNGEDPWTSLSQVKTKRYYDGDEEVENFDTILRANK